MLVRNLDDQLIISSQLYIKLKALHFIRDSSEDDDKDDEIAELFRDDPTSLRHLLEDVFKQMIMCRMLINSNSSS